MAAVLPEEMGQIEQITFYKATDGNLFNDEESCKNYQQTIDLIKKDICFFNSSFSKFQFATSNLNNFTVKMGNYDYIAVSSLDSWNKLLETYLSNIDTTERELPTVLKDGYYYYDKTFNKWKHFQDEIDSLTETLNQLKKPTQGTS